MTAWAAREHHRFEAAGKPFVYLVPSAAIFALDDAADRVLRTVSQHPRTRDELNAGSVSRVRAVRAARVHDPESRPGIRLVDAGEASASQRAAGKQAKDAHLVPLGRFDVKTHALPRQPWKTARMQESRRVPFTPARGRRPAGFVVY